METQKEYNPSTLLEIKTNGNRILIGQKWQEKTRGGFEYRIYEEFQGKIFGRVKQCGDWIGTHWYLDGYFFGEIDEHRWDLLLYNPLLTTLEKELEEVRLKEKELLEKIEELKTK